MITDKIDQFPKNQLLVQQKRVNSSRHFLTDRFLNLVGPSSKLSTKFANYVKITSLDIATEVPKRPFPLQTSIRTPHVINDDSKMSTVAEVSGFSAAHVDSSAPVSCQDAEIQLSVRAYSKMILHAAKYPHCAINGVLITKRSSR